MSFARQFDAEIQRLAPLFAAAANADRGFHEAWKEGVAKIGSVKYKKTERYIETLEQFHAARQAVDRILSTAFTEAKLGDSVRLPTLFAYVAIPGRYFWSGYQRAQIWRFLKKLALDEEQLAILRGIVLQQIKAAGPEFVEISRAARRLDSADFRAELENLVLRSEKQYVRRRAEKLQALLVSTSR
jgi:hypothetical protein